MADVPPWQPPESPPPAPPAPPWGSPQPPPPAGWGAPQPTSGFAGPGTCQYCGRTPAATITLRQVRSRRQARQGLPADATSTVCKPCGTALTRSAFSRIMGRGAFLNLPTLLRNRAARASVRSLPDPLGAPLGPALDPGRPVYLRATILVPLILIGLIAGAVAVGVSQEDVQNLSKGECFDFPSGTGQFSSVDLQPCNQPHEGQVVGRIPPAADAVSQQRCHSLALTTVTSAAGSVNGLRTNVIHLLSSDGSSSSGAQDVCVVELAGHTKFRGSVVPS